MVVINNRISKLSTVKDENMKEALVDFGNQWLKLYTVPDKKKFIYHFNMLTEMVCNYQLKTLNWKEFRFNAISSPQHIGILSKFLAFLVEQQLYSGNYAEKLTQLIPFLNRECQTNTMLRLFEKEGLDTAYLYDASKLLFINAKSLFLRDQLWEFFKTSPNHNYNRQLFFADFDESLGKYQKISSIDEFNIHVFNHQFEYFQIKNDIKSLKSLTSFYSFIINKYNDQTIFTVNDGLDGITLYRPNFVAEYSIGIRLVPYNPFEPIPEPDKWIQSPNGFEHTSTQFHSKDYFLVNFTTVKNIKHRKWLKQWFWQAEGDLFQKNKDRSNITTFLNFIDNLNNNPKIQDFKSERNSIVDFSTSDAVTYKQYIQKNYKSESNINSYIYCARKFISFITSHNLATIENGVMYHLTRKYRMKSSEALSIPEVELAKLEKVFKLETENSYIGTLFYAIFHIVLQTEFRISQVVQLRANCVRETMKKNQFVLHSNTKVSKGEVVEQAISSYTKRHLDEVIEYTKDARKNCHDETISQHLFIYKYRDWPYKIISAEKFNKHLKKCCIAANIPIYTSKNIRDTHMTKAEEHRLRKGLSNLETSILTGHKNIDTTNNHYIHTKTRDMLEAVYGTVIGNVDIKGRVLQTVENSVSKKENIVGNNCGFCSENACNQPTNLDCPLCPSFIATVDRIPYFEDEITKINQRLPMITIPHEKESLDSIKRLLLTYLEQLYILMEASADE